MTVDTILPRPEYPRPDRRRGSVEGVDWLNLNGPWEFRFDPDRAGVDQKWFEPNSAPWNEQIIVPFCWEALAAWREGDAAGNENYYSTRVFLNPLEVNDMNHRAAPRHEVGWYRREVVIPDSQIWRDKRIILTVGAADFFTDAWCNGKFLGHHEGGYTPFEFDITDALQSREDGTRSGIVVFRVEDPMQNHEQPVGKQWRWYTTTSGIWQTVFVEPRCEAYIESFRITPDIDERNAHFAISCVGCENCVIEIRVTAPDGTVLPETQVRVERGIANAHIPIEPLMLWDPNAPHLYKTMLLLNRDGELIDVVHTYFGMRKVDFTPSASPNEVTHLRFNGNPRYLRGALYQSYFPEGVYTAGSVDRLKNDIRWAKHFGFNFLRIHIKIDDPLFLYYADTMGIFIMADFPNFGEKGNTPLGRRRFEQLMREAIKRDFNHPSIFAWCMFNETWGFGGQAEFVELIHPTRPIIPEPNEYEPAAVSVGSPAVRAADAAAPEALRQAETAAHRSKLSNLDAHTWVQKMWELAKHLDPTRLVEDMSVCHWEHLDYYAHGDTDINSWHFYMHDYAKAKEHIAKVVSSTYTGSEFNYVPGFQHRGQPLINSEYGGIGALDGDRDMSWSFKFLTNELRRHDKISAYIYTELHDVEWEYNGFLNYDRTPKEFGYDPNLINSANLLVLDSPPASLVKPGEAVRLPVSSSHYSTRHHENVTLRWRFGGLDTQAFARNIEQGSAPIPFPHRQVSEPYTIQLHMPDEPMLCIVLVEAVAPDSAILARNFVHYLVMDDYPPTREEHDHCLILRQPPHSWTKAEWSGRCRVRERAETEDSCFASGHGFFEWEFQIGREELGKATRLRLLAELSSRRHNTPQTDEDLFPTTAELLLNDVPVHRLILPNHPHDSRGVLSYLRNARGAYGYLASVSIHGDLLRRVVEQHNGNAIRLRCGVPADAPDQGGLTVYGAKCGRYPICPTVVLEWEKQS